MFILILNIFTFIFSLLLLLPLSLLAVELDSPAFPNNVNSAMYSLEDLCNRLQNGAIGVKRNANFVEPPSGPITGVGCSLNEAMSIAPAVDNINGARPDEVLSGKTFWGLRTDGHWGLQTGTLIPEEGNFTDILPTEEGYESDEEEYESDAPYVVNTLSGDATEEDIVSGKKAWVDGQEVTGTLVIETSTPVAEIPTQELSDSNIEVKAGKYEATTLDAIDPDLVDDNIKSGITLFGITGNSNVVNTASGDATAADIALGKTAWVDGKEVTGTRVTDCPSQ